MEDQTKTQQTDPQQDTAELKAARERAAKRIEREQANAAAGRESLFAQRDRYEF